MELNIDLRNRAHGGTPRRTILVHRKLEQDTEFKSCFNVLLGSMLGDFVHQRTMHLLGCGQECDVVEGCLGADLAEAQANKPCVQTTKSAREMTSYCLAVLSLGKRNVG